MWGNKKEELKTLYYKIFLFLIVIPILVIMLVSVGVIRSMMGDAAVRNIRRMQDNIVTTLSTEVKDVSLRLSHFVYVNDNENMRLAAATNTSDVAERYHSTMELSESFNYAMVPVQNILSAVFFMKDGTSTYMKEDIVLTREELKQAHWYQDAVADKNIIKVGFYDTNVTFSRQSAQSLTIVAGLSPGIDVDRDGSMEMTALFATSQAGKLIRDYNTEKLSGATLLLDSGGDVIFGEKDIRDKLPGREGWWNDEVSRHTAGSREYVYIVTVEPVTGCRVVSIMESQALTRDFNRVAAIILAVTIILLVSFFCFSSYFLKNIVHPVHNVVEGMKEVEEGNLEIHLEPSGQSEIRTMVHSFNRMVRRLKQLMEENAEQQEKKHEAEIRALQSQINPHFLVNSLNSIRFMAQVSKFDGIRRMAEALIKILSTSFRSNTGFHTVQEELEVLDGFIYLMKIRYSDGFDISYHVEEACRQMVTPRLILQPIVENSIVHGFSDMVDEFGRIELTVKQEEGQLVFIIRDNGKGMSEEGIRELLSGSPREGGDHTSIGVMNVAARLKLNYGESCGLSMESTPGSCLITTMRLPVCHAEVKGERGTEHEPGV